MNRFALFLICFGCLFVLIDLAIGQKPISSGLSVSLEDYKQCIRFCGERTNLEERKVCMEGCRELENTSGNYSLENLSPRITSQFKTKDNKTVKVQDVLDALPEYLQKEDKEVLSYYIRRSFTGINLNQEDPMRDGMQGFKKAFVYYREKRRPQGPNESRVLYCEEVCKEENPNDIIRYTHCWWLCVIHSKSIEGIELNRNNGPAKIKN